MLQVLKLRGSGFPSASTPTGSRSRRPRRLPSPRRRPRLDRLHARRPSGVSTGIPALDETLGDGYWPGAVDPHAPARPGAGKTLMGLHFMFHGAEHGEPGVIATFQENPTQLARIVERLRLGLSTNADVQRARPLAGRPLHRRMGLRAARRASSGPAPAASSSTASAICNSRPATTIRFREFMYSAVQRCARQGVSLIMTTSSPSSSVSTDSPSSACPTSPTTSSYSNTSAANH